MSSLKKSASACFKSDNALAAFNHVMETKEYSALPQSGSWISGVSGKPRLQADAENPTRSPDR